MDFDAGHVFDAAVDQLFSFLHREERRFAFVLEHGDENAIEKTRAATNDVEMTVRQRIERARIHGDVHERMVPYTAGA